VRVAVFAQGEKAKEAEEAGADVVGAEDLAKRVEEGFTDFDVAIATPDMMGVVGRLEYRTDRGANVHVAIGKKSFEEKALLENYATVVEEIVRAKPAAAKGRNIRKITQTSTMGPGIHLDTTRTRDVAAEIEDGDSAEAESLVS
jgi:large subunit ribosomal protein L1